MQRLFALDIPFMKHTLDIFIATIKQYDEDTLNKQVIHGEKQQIPPNITTGDRHKQRHRPNAKTALATIFTNKQSVVEKEDRISHLHKEYISKFYENMDTIPHLGHRLLYILLYLIMFNTEMKTIFIASDTTSVSGRFFAPEFMDQYCIYYAGLVKKTHTKEKRKEVYLCSKPPTTFLAYEMDRFRRLQECI